MKLLLTALLTCSVSFASVKIYKNSSELTYTPTSTFIGFNQNMNASNTDGSVKILKGSCLNSTLATCKIVNKINSLSNNNDSLQRQKKVMQQSLDNFYSDYKSAKNNIDYISTMSNSIAAINEKITINNDEINRLKQTNYFRVYNPYYLAKNDQKEIKLNFNGISFYSKYILNLDKSKLNHSLNITNRSGVDIKKTTAYIFDRNHYATTPNVAFRPSTVSKMKKYAEDKMMMAESVAPRQYKAKVAKRSMSADSYGSVPSVSKTSTKSYKIDNFSLDTSANEKKFVVDSKKVKVNKRTIWRTWQNAAFVQGEFAIADTLENNRIDIIYKNSLTKNNFIRVEDAKQIFNIVQEYDLKVKRKEVPTFTQSKGIFNSDTMTKKTIKLQVTNMSNTTKKLDIYEKIPVSTDEDIKVNLNNFSEIKNKTKVPAEVDYNNKNGKLQLHVELKPKEFKEYVYEYTIRHPKKIEVSVNR